MIGLGIISRLQKNINQLKSDDILGAIKEVYSNRIRIKTALDRESKRIFKAKKENELILDALKMTKRVANLNLEKSEENN